MYKESFCIVREISPSFHLCTKETHAFQTLALHSRSSCCCVLSSFGQAWLRCCHPSQILQPVLLLLASTPGRRHSCQRRQCHSSVHGYQPSIGLDPVPHRIHQKRSLCVHQWVRSGHWSYRPITVWFEGE